MIVAVGLLAGSRVAHAVPLSPLAQTGINQINAAANSFEDWAEFACPIFADIVADASETDPELGLFYAEVYTDVVGDVADAYIASVNSLARTYSLLTPSLTDKAAIEAARLAAIARIMLIEAECVAEIQGLPEAPA
jgi:hypothetical protein